MEHIMTMLTRIGNSQGIRIPKPLIIQANLENTQLYLKVIEEGLLIKPILNTRRKNWKSNIESILSKNKDKKDEAVISELLDDSDLEDFKW
jgi:antitoxin MazE